MIDVHKTFTRLQDGILAGGSCFIASSAVAQQSMQQVAHDVNTGANPLITQVAIPIITGIVVPFLKEWLIELKERRRERRRRKKDVTSTVSEQ